MKNIKAPTPTNHQVQEPTRAQRAIAECADRVCSEGVLEPIDRGGMSPQTGGEARETAISNPVLTQTHLNALFLFSVCLLESVSKIIMHSNKPKHGLTLFRVSNCRLQD